MIKLFDKDTSKELGEITKDQLQFLIDQLEEEGLDDQDYYINEATLVSFNEKIKKEAELMDMLKKGMAGKEDMEIEWKEV